MPEHMRLPLTHMTGLLITLLALAVAWIVAVGLAPAASAVSSLSDAGQMAYTYDAPRLSTEYNDAVSQRGPPPVACDYTTHPLPVEVASYGPSPRQSPPSARTYDDYDRSVQLTHGDNARATTRTVTACRDGNVRLVAGASVAAKSADEVLGALSYSTKIEGQMATRGWTKEAIETTIQNPTATHTVWDLTSGTKHAATAYVQRGGGYVVLNDETRAVVQISNLNKAGWKPVWEDPRFMR